MPMRLPAPAMERLVAEVARGLVGGVDAHTRDRGEGGRREEHRTYGALTGGPIILEIIFFPRSKCHVMQPSQKPFKIVLEGVIHPD